MTDIIITKLSGDCSDNDLRFIHQPSGDDNCTPGATSGNPPVGTLYTWVQTYRFRNGAAGTGDTVTISNFNSLDFELCSPAGDFPIPELRDTCNILVKAEGNRLQINISWTMIDEPATIFAPSAGHAAQNIATVQQQLDFWLNTFQVNSIEDAYLIAVDGITRMGTFRKISFSKSETTPITYSARLEFISGNVVAGEA